MKTYVLLSDGVVVEVIRPLVDAEGQEIPIADRYTPEFVAAMADVSGMSPFPAEGWVKTGDGFAAPDTTPTEDDLRDAALAKRDSLLRDVALRIAPIQDAVDLGEATAQEVADLRQYKLGRIELSRIDKQAGYPASITWPTFPAA
jgi:hypothetical protein